METEDKIQEIVDHNRRISKKGLKVATINFIVALMTFAFSIALLGRSVSYTVPPQIIQLSESGSLFKKTPLDLPTKTDKELKQWYVDAVDRTFDFSYRTMEVHPTTLSNIYSPDALASIDKFINSSNFGVRVRNQFGIVEVVISEEVKISEGKLGNRLGWSISTRAALMIYMNGQPLRAAVYDITGLVVRENEDINPEGMVINTISFKEVN